MGIQLNQQQQLKKQLILQYLKGEISSKQVAIQIGYTHRGAQRIIHEYKERGDESLIHAAIGRKKSHPKYEKLGKEIIDIFMNTRVDGKNPFENISYSYFNSILKEEYNIDVSLSFLKKTLNNIGYFTPVSHKLKKKSNMHLFRERKEHIGELIQADGTEFDWFMNGKKYTIQGFVDDATGLPVGLYMTRNECLLGYIEAFRNMAENYGIPEQLYPDKAGVFFVNRKTKDGEKHLTQFGLMMENFGVDMFPAHSPQAKGRIERFWGTIKGRLPHLLALRGINTIEAANEFLRNEFPKIYKRWFPVEPKSSESHFVPADFKQITEILKATFPGKTDKSGVFTLKGYRFFCPELPNTKILIHLNEKEGLWVTEINKSKKYSVHLVESDTSGEMPEVMKDLIDRIFLKNAKPRFREVYIDVDDIILSQIKSKHLA